MEFGMKRTRALRTSGLRLARLLGLGLLMASMLLVATVSVGCDTPSYAQTIRIVAEPVNISGLFARIEYLRDGEVANSVHLVDGNGDGIIDGKSGPSEEGMWPVGWEWFDDMYADVVVGQTSMDFDGQKVVVNESSTYEFIVGEYECGASS
ncbi:hypothetical protein ACFLUT_00735 [Chloroflexota bacterium]